MTASKEGLHVRSMLCGRRRQAGSSSGLGDTRSRRDADGIPTGTPTAFGLPGAGVPQPQPRGRDTTSDRRPGAAEGKPFDAESPEHIWMKVIDRSI